MGLLNADPMLAATPWMDPMLFILGARRKHPTPQRKGRGLGLGVGARGWGLAGQIMYSVMIPSSVICHGHGGGTRTGDMAAHTQGRPELSSAGTMVTAVAVTLTALLSVSLTILMVVVMARAMVTTLAATQETTMLATRIAVAMTSMMARVRHCDATTGMQGGATEGVGPRRGRRAVVGCTRVGHTLSDLLSWRQVAHDCIARPRAASKYMC